jgi:hypothetical protein
MKLWISIITSVSLSLICTARADNYSALATQGYRWVTVNGPYACATEQDVQRILGHGTDEVELHMVESIRCYYLIPGTIVEVIKEDPARVCRRCGSEASLGLYGPTRDSSVNIRSMTLTELPRRRKTLV